MYAYNNMPPTKLTTTESYWTSIQHRPSSKTIERGVPQQVPVEVPYNHPFTAGEAKQQLLKFGFGQHMLTWRGKISRDECHSS